MRPTSWFEISLSTSWPKKSNLSRWSRLIRAKFYPWRTVHAPLDAYGSKELWKKKSMCWFQSYFFFFIDIIEYREGGQNSCKKKRILWTYWTNFSLMHSFIEIRITLVARVLSQNVVGWQDLISLYRMQFRVQLDLRFMLSNFLDHDASLSHAGPIGGSYYITRITRSLGIWNCLPPMTHVTAPTLITRTTMVSFRFLRVDGRRNQR